MLSAVFLDKAPSIFKVPDVLALTVSYFDDIAVTNWNISLAMQEQPLLWSDCTWEQYAKVALNEKNKRWEAVAKLACPILAQEVISGEFLFWGGAWQDQSQIEVGEMEGHIAELQRRGLSASSMTTLSLDVLDPTIRPNNSGRATLLSSTIAHISFYKLPIRALYYAMNKTDIKQLTPYFMQEIFFRIRQKDRPNLLRRIFQRFPRLKETTKDDPGYIKELVVTNDSALPAPRSALFLLKQEYSFRLEDLHPLFSKKMNRHAHLKKKNYDADCRKILELLDENGASPDSIAPSIYSDIVGCRLVQCRRFIVQNYPHLVVPV